MSERHFIAVIGGACAGSEITSHMVEAGHEVAVFDMNPLPYGKIEDGLPRWHAKLRQREQKIIDGKLDNPNVHYIPKTALGRDVALGDLIEDWGFSLVVLATGAWRDRPMPVKGLDGVSDLSFVYQNDFLHWYNRHLDADYAGDRYEVSEGAVIVGGGLASIDVGKICQFEMIQKTMAARGIEVDLEELEKRGVEKALAAHGVSMDDLNFQPARVYYRRSMAEMPLVPMSDNPDEREQEKAKKTREKIITNAMTRYGFEVHPMRVATEITVTDGGVSAVVFKRTEYVDGRLTVTDETETVETRLLISSIGSIPRPIKGIPMDGELFRTSDKVTGQLVDFPGVFAVGNAITGKGNIRASVKSARGLGSLLSDGFSATAEDYEALISEQRANAREHVRVLLEFLAGLAPRKVEEMDKIRGKIRQRQDQLDYPDDYPSWRDSVLSRR